MKNVLSKLSLLLVFTAVTLQFAMAQWVPQGGSSIGTYKTPPIAFLQMNVQTQCELKVYKNKLYDAAKYGALLTKEQKSILIKFYNDFVSRGVTTLNYNGRNIKYPLPANYSYSYQQLVAKSVSMGGCSPSTSRTTATAGGYASSGGGSRGNASVPAGSSIADNISSNIIDNLSPNEVLIAGTAVVAIIGTTYLINNFFEKKKAKAEEEARVKQAEASARERAQEDAIKLKNVLREII